MIDLHIHTTYSDGDKNVEDVLKMCEEKRLEYISITDHNTCKQYEDKEIKENSIFSGVIIKGAELNANFKNKRIELLAYNIKETKIIEEWAEKYFSEEILKRQQDESKNKLLKICDKKGLIYDENKIEKNIPLTDYITIYVYKELMRHKENHKILGKYAESLNYFIRKGLMNPGSDFYIEDEHKPMYKDVIEVIHKAGGLAFLAHPFEYRIEDTFEFIDELRKECELDGIECFHPSANENERKELVKYARDNDLFISGGSDYHGKKKPDVELGIGKGDLNISKEIIKEWITR